MVMVIEFMKWWYGSGWLKAFHKTVEWTNEVRYDFSISILVGTLFSPWRQIISIPGKSLDAKIRSLVDNLVSRVVGFFVRLIVLFTALLLYILAATAGFVLAVVWPLLPLLFVYFLLRSFIG